MERYKSIFEGAGDYYDKKYHVLGISLDISKNKNMYLLGFKKESNADLAKEYFESITDYTVFSVDNYGYSTFENAENYFSKYSNIVAFSGLNTDRAIKENPDAVVKQVYDVLK